MQRRAAAVALCAAGLLAAACNGETDTVLDRATVAFVLVGQADDLGYNQAVHDGTLEVARRFPDVELLRVENVPETQEAADVMRRLVVEDGADLVFATSFGHLPHAYEVAREHPDVVFVHQGGTEPAPGLHNFGTYFGSHWEAMFEAGVAAGHATVTGHLGFVAAFPIPATHANVNAFTLGARRVRPDVTTTVTFTDAWCDPAVQEAAVDDLVAADVDVLALHQDCTETILREAERRRLAGVVGYHSDGSEVAPTRWLAGAVWTWGPLYADIVSSVLDGTFVDGVYSGDFRGSIADGNNPFTLTVPGPAAGPRAVQDMRAVRSEVERGESPFTGPLLDADGQVVVPADETLSLPEIDRMDWFVEGVEVL